ncbi:hypothetical protein EIP91_005580, partial [Steccherinum ochraceum]
LEELEYWDIPSLASVDALVRTHSLTQSWDMTEPVESILSILSDLPLLRYLDLKFEWQSELPSSSRSSGLVHVTLPHLQGLKLHSEGGRIEYDDILPSIVDIVGQRLEQHKHNADSSLHCQAALFVSLKEPGDTFSLWSDPADECLLAPFSLSFADDMSAGYFAPASWCNIYGHMEQVEVVIISGPTFVSNAMRSLDPSHDIHAACSNAGGLLHTSQPTLLFPRLRVLVILGACTWWSLDSPQTRWCQLCNTLAHRKQAGHPVEKLVLVRTSSDNPRIQFEVPPHIADSLHGVVDEIVECDDHYDGTLSAALAESCTPGFIRELGRLQEPGSQMKEWK